MNPCCPDAVDREGKAMLAHPRSRAVYRVSAAARGKDAAKRTRTVAGNTRATALAEESRGRRKR